MGIREEGVWLSDQVLAVTAYLQDCWEKLEMGREDLIRIDPLTVREPRLTDEEVEKAFSAMDSEYEHEMNNYKSHHLNRSGATERTGWDRMGKAGRRAVIEGCDYLLRTVQDDREPAYQPPIQDSYEGC